MAALVATVKWRDGHVTRQQLTPATVHGYCARLAASRVVLSVRVDSGARSEWSLR